ncbi:MAG: hypothetical protein KBD31_02770 [Proteobacteria bacterium]|nr:hypothetical protein [Pseudomonadota bacterium]
MIIKKIIRNIWIQQIAFIFILGSETFATEEQITTVELRKNVAEIMFQDDDDDDSDLFNNDDGQFQIYENIDVDTFLIMAIKLLETSIPDNTFMFSSIEDFLRINIEDSLKQAFIKINLQIPLDIRNNIWKSFLGDNITRYLVQNNEEDMVYNLKLIPNIINSFAGIFLKSIECFLDEESIREVIYSLYLPVLENGKMNYSAQSAESLLLMFHTYQPESAQIIKNLRAYTRGSRLNPIISLVGSGLSALNKISAGKNEKIKILKDVLLLNPEESRDSTLYSAYDADLSPQLMAEYQNEITVYLQNYLSAYINNIYTLVHSKMHVTNDCMIVFKNIFYFRNTLEKFLNDVSSRLKEDIDKNINVLNNPKLSENMKAEKQSKINDENHTYEMLIRDLDNFNRFFEQQEIFTLAPVVEQKEQSDLSEYFTLFLPRSEKQGGEYIGWIVLEMTDIPYTSRAHASLLKISFNISAFAMGSNNSLLKGKDDECVLTPDVKNKMDYLMMALNDSYMDRKFFGLGTFNVNVNMHNSWMRFPLPGLLKSELLIIDFINKTVEVKRTRGIIRFQTIGQLLKFMSVLSDRYLKKDVALTLNVINDSLCNVRNLFQPIAVSVSV